MVLLSVHAKNDVTSFLACTDKSAILHRHKRSNTKRLVKYLISSLIKLIEGVQTKQQFIGNTLFDIFRPYQFQLKTT